MPGETNTKPQDPIAARIAEAGFVLLDGGLASELEAGGYALDDPLWSAKALIDAPDRIRAIHTAYLAAGADVLTTATYQAHFVGFRRHGVGTRAAAHYLRLSIDIAREARSAFLEGMPTGDAWKPLIAASVGPYGAVLQDGSEYRGDYRMTLRELKAFHRSRLEVLLEAEPDLLACETIPNRREAEALIDLLDEFSWPAWVSFSCRDDQHISDGERFADAIRQVSDCPYVVAAGLNCTPPRHVLPLLHAIADAAKPVLVYPNRGDIWDAMARAWIAPPEAGEFPAHVAAWFAAGARLLGGCCRTTPDDIRAMRVCLRELIAASPV